MPASPQSSSSGDESSSDASSPPARRVLPPRAKRGQRMHELMTNEEKQKMYAPEDEFYKEYFAEADDDAEFEVEEGSSDDDDLIDSDEESEADGADSEEDPEEALRRQEKEDKKKAKNKRERGAAASKKAIAAAANADSSDEEFKAGKTAKRIKEEYGMAQDALMKEAMEQTAEMNKESLASLLRIEEEKKKITVKKKILSGPRVLYKSFTVQDDGKKSQKMERHTVSFVQCELPWVFANEKPAPVHAKKCSITGKPAKYLDPVTKCGFVSVEAFKQLRAKKKGKK